MVVQYVDTFMIEANFTEALKYYMRFCTAI